MPYAFITTEAPIIAEYAFKDLNVAAVVVFGIIALLLGAIECFAGYKLLRLLVAIWGFFAGALLGTVVGILADSLVVGTILVLILGGALVFLAIKYKKAGIGIQVSFMVVAAIYLIIARMADVTADFWWWPLLISVALAAPCGLLATKFTKSMVIFSSAFGGASVMFVSASIMILGKLSPTFVLMMIFLIPIALMGIVVQYLTTMKKTIYVPGAQNAKEKRFPGMQVVYKNYCIRCGATLLDDDKKCPQCGFIE